MTCLVKSIVELLKSILPINTTFLHGNLDPRLCYVLSLNLFPGPPNKPHHLHLTLDALKSIT